MRGKRAIIEIQLETSRRKKALTVEAMSYGPLALVERTNERMGFCWYIVHVATGATVVTCITTKARAMKYLRMLLDSGINWDFDRPDRMSGPDRRTAREIVGKAR